jgi:hypothetical protein
MAMASRSPQKTSRRSKRRQSFLTIDPYSSPSGFHDAPWGHDIWDYYILRLALPVLTRRQPYILM